MTGETRAGSLTRRTFALLDIAADDLMAWISLISPCTGNDCQHRVEKRRRSYLRSTVLLLC